jgi:serine/threonine protein kinase
MRSSIALVVQGYGADCEWSHRQYAEYMPPEMIRGKAYNQAVDWWALGALIYEMVTGYPPFVHKNRKKLHQKILNEKVTSSMES